MTSARAVASSILLSLLLVGGLAACDTAAPSDDTAVDTGSSSDEGESADGGGFEGVTLAGTGDYAVPDAAPIGGFELPDNQDALPEGCTWTVYVGDEVLADSNGPFVFLTDVTTRFVTTGCPDWVQFE
jgi:hypothetical protein